MFWKLDSQVFKIGRGGVTMLAGNTSDRAAVDHCIPYGTGIVGTSQRTTTRRTNRRVVVRHGGTTRAEEEQVGYPGMYLIIYIYIYLTIYIYILIHSIYV